MIYRLISLNSNSIPQIRVSFNGGYVYAIFQVFLVKCIPYTLQRICLVIVLYFLRFGFIFFVIDRSSLQPLSLIRAAVIDAFIVFYFHSSDSTERKVFLNFDEKREELLKFKELVAESLPLGVIVVNSQTMTTLFSNFAYLKLFENDSNSEENDSTLNYLNLLYVDKTTIREMGQEHYDFQVSSLDDNLICLEDVLKNLIEVGALANNTLSLTASEKCQTNPRTFDVTLKRIKWNGVDATSLVLNDITYQENMMCLKMVNANKDKIIATVSHELRTPLNGIIGLLDMAEKKIEDFESLEYISLCKDNSHLLLGLVNSILDLHQIRAGKLKLVISEVSVRKCLQGVLRLFQFQTTQKGISCSLGE